ncbi:hemin uptake protein HemP [Aestuariivita sp.]|jgi:hemin uptake protein HemP|uniref:hemin uptake protein HemP n=1 Tax=Aestuariivita sp. TaxID=1872407 RepID=UPI00216F465F|nr:hemin uptake protein HemP [Aestuariivita sp.]MCE8008681.1 hemin uptake protein HemP [Aestuariivita sp.]
MTAQIPQRLPAHSVPALPRYDATDLVRGGDLAEIILGDQIYRLRITKSGKLILTK